MNKENLNRLKAIAMAISTLGLSTGCTTKVENKQLNTEDGIVMIDEEQEEIEKEIETTTTEKTTTTTKATTTTTTETTATTTYKFEETQQSTETYQRATFKADEYEVCRNIAGASNKALALVKETETTKSI